MPQLLRTLRFAAQHSVRSTPEARAAVKKVEEILAGDHKAEREHPEFRHVSGTVVVSATQLTGQMNGNDPRAFRWVLDYPETQILNDSLHVFAVRDAPPQGVSRKR
jgi:hypothetical protein